jgi:hypothetical protein
MKDEPRQKTVDSNTAREVEKRSIQSAERSEPGQAPLKEHGQPAWRKVKPD